MQIFTDFFPVMQSVVWSRQKLFSNIIRGQPEGAKTQKINKRRELPTGSRFPPGYRWGATTLPTLRPSSQLPFRRALPESSPQ